MSDNIITLGSVVNRYCWLFTAETRDDPLFSGINNFLVDMTGHFPDPMAMIHKWDVNNRKFVMEMVAELPMDSMKYTIKMLLFKVRLGFNP